MTEPKALTAPRTHETVLELFDARKGVLIDAGAGEGKLSEILRHQGFIVIALDVCAHIFKVECIPLIITDLNYGFPIRDESVDYVTAIEVIEHLWNPLNLIKDIYRILKIKGELILTTPNIENLWQRIYYLLTGKFIYFRNIYSHGGHIMPIFHRTIIAFIQKRFHLKTRTYNSIYIPFLNSILQFMKRPQIRYKPNILLNHYFGDISIYRFIKASPRG